MTRNPERRRLLEESQAKQLQLRAAARGIKRSGPTAAAEKLQASEERILALELGEAARVASHVAMIHAMAELGGTAKLQQFYGKYAQIRDGLSRAGALPPQFVDNVVSLQRH